jgi:hypothetical protein
MIIRVHGFDWGIYTERVMPAFASWLIDRDETAIHQLFERTRCALEEQFLPKTMQRSRIWPRAKTFVDALPLGPHSRREYTKLCSAEQFTILSDQYLHSYTPHLYQDSAALRCIWGAIIEEYCLPWFHAPPDGITGEQTITARVEIEQEIRGELVSLLNSAGLADLAQEVNELSSQVERYDWVPEQYEEEEFDLYADEEDPESARRQGIILGSQTQIMQLRGWLATISIRAMVLFEYLACSRRRMPFNYETGEPFGAFSGYLTQEEVWQLASCLHKVSPPDHIQAHEDYRHFCQEQTRDQLSLRLVDEVLPANAHDFLNAVHRAAFQGIGLICSMD